MSRPQTFEQSLYDRAEQVLQDCSNCFDDRMLVLEACAALYGGFDIREYWKEFGIICSDDQAIKDKANVLYNEINNTGISPSLVISSLSREIIPVSEMKKQGAFYTDFRLAEFIACNCAPYLKKNSDIADIAVGSGILLAGIAEKYYAKYASNYDAWLSQHVYAYDLSANALRGARIALSVHTASVSALAEMYKNWRTCDTLFSEEIESNNFDIVVGNPPWGKTKLSLHAFVNDNGANHIYGSEYVQFDTDAFENERANLLEYSKNLKKRYALLGDSEPDMYMAFLQRALSMVRPHGHLEYIIPAGLIRSKGTEPLRRYLINEGKHIKYYLLDNKARFFEIDSRFKFLVLSHDKASTQKKGCSEFSLTLCTADQHDIKKGDEIPYGVEELENIRSDLTIPECKNKKEKELLFKIYSNGREWKDEWAADVSREVDMTNNRKDFTTVNSSNGIPVVEGRMVQQFRFGAKAYVSGKGRSATWIPTANKELKPQFFMNSNRMSQSLRDRISHPRVGYCDIAGQTNERAMMSTLIPPMVVCGNKVPTIYFKKENSDYSYLWLGVTNSFVFDWLLRRIISTTVNYFLLFSIPMPDIEIDSIVAKEISSKAKELCNMNEEFYTDHRMAELRADIDVLVAKAYGLNFSDIELLMEDFPLLDRAQKTRGNDNRSTVTRDMLLSYAEKKYSCREKKYTQRYNEEYEIGAKAYIPTEMVELCK